MRNKMSKTTGILIPLLGRRRWNFNYNLISYLTQKEVHEQYDAEEED